MLVMFNSLKSVCYSLWKRMIQNIAARFDVQQHMISSLGKFFLPSQQCLGCSWVRTTMCTTCQQDSNFRLIHLRNRFQTACLTTQNIPGLRPPSPGTKKSVKQISHMAWICCHQTSSLVMSWQVVLGADVIYNSPGDSVTRLYNSK